MKKANLKQNKRVQNFEKEVKTLIFELLEEKINNIANATVDEAQELEIDPKVANFNALTQAAKEENCNLTQNNKGETVCVDPETGEERGVDDKTEENSGIAESEYPPELEEIVFQEIRRALDENFAYLLSGIEKS